MGSYLAPNKGMNLGPDSESYSNPTLTGPPGIPNILKLKALFLQNISKCHKQN